MSTISTTCIVILRATEEILIVEFAMSTTISLNHEVIIIIVSPGIVLGDDGDGDEEDDDDDGYWSSTPNPLKHKRILLVIPKELAVYYLFSFVY